MKALGNKPPDNKAPGSEPPDDKAPGSEPPDDKAPGSEPPDDNELSIELKKLQSVLNAPGSSESKESWRYTGRIGDPESNKFIDVFIAFDEAHALSKAINNANESCFVVLCQVLSSISSCPLYTFFLSTTGSITQFAHPRQQDPSSRISSGVLSTPRPYICLGFDQLMQDCKVFEQWKTLNDVTSLECAAHMGRPL
jgi:hypothetical protein